MECYCAQNPHKACNFELQSQIQRYQYNPSNQTQECRLLPLQDNNLNRIAYDITGASIEQLESYIVKGIPILTWITIDLETARVNDSLKWQERNTLKEHIPYTNLHAVVLLGLDGNYANVMNPLTGYESIPIDVFKQSFESLQSRAVVIY